MRRTALRGHALRGEGAAHIFSEEEVWLRCSGHIGQALCQCGAYSGPLSSNAARKRWHAQHKDAVRGAFDMAPGQ